MSYGVSQWACLPSEGFRRSLIVTRVPIPEDVSNSNSVSYRDWRRLCGSFAEVPNWREINTPVEADRKCSVGVVPLKVRKCHVPHFTGLRSRARSHRKGPTDRPTTGFLAGRTRLAARLCRQTETRSQTAAVQADRNIPPEARLHGALRRGPSRTNDVPVTVAWLSAGPESVANVYRVGFQDVRVLAIWKGLSAEQRAAAAGCVTLTCPNGVTLRQPNGAHAHRFYLPRHARCLLRNLPNQD